MDIPISSIMRKAAVFLMILGLIGCNAQVENFVSVGDKAPTNTTPTDPNTPPPASQSSDGTKISPGEIRSTSTNAGIKATVSPTRQRLLSGNLGMRVGIQKKSN